MKRGSKRNPVAAALVLVAIAGLVLACSDTIGDASSSPTSPPPPTAAPTSTSNPSPSTVATIAPTRTPGPWVLPDGPLVAHEYFSAPFGPPNEHLTFTFEVPEGWYGFQGGGLFPETGTEAPTGMGMGFGMIERLHSDPCKGKVNGVPVNGDVVVGPTVDDLVGALREQTAYQTSAPIDVELGGYSGQKVSLQFPTEFDCELDAFRPWEGSIHPQGHGDRWHLWILDVEGVCVLVLTLDYAATPAEDRAELQGILDSLRITP